MSVTATRIPASATTSRNALIAAEAIAHAREHIGDWERYKSLTGAESREQAEAALIARYAQQSAYQCQHYNCKRKQPHVFVEGDTVHVIRQSKSGPWGPSWSYVAWCAECVGGRFGAGKPCESGCGVDVVTLSYSRRPTFWGPYEARTCSRRCAKRAASERKRLEHERTHTRRCEVCEETFVPQRADARYCSNACRQDAYRKRKLGAAA